MGEEYVSRKKDVKDPSVTDWDRPLKLSRPCNCGCDARGGTKGVGYISGGSGNAFFSIWIENEATYQALATLLKKHGIPTDK